MKIKHKLAAGIGLVVLLLIAASTYAMIYSMEKAIVDETQVRNAQITKYVGKMADLYLLERASGVGNLAKQQNSAEALSGRDPAKLSKLISDVTGINERVGIITSIGIFDENCTLVALDRLSTANVTGKSYADRDYCKGVQSTGQAYVSSIYTSTNTNKPSIGIAFPMQDSGGKMVGFLLTSMSVEMLAESLREVQQYDSRIILLDRYGTEFVDTGASGSYDSYDISNAVNGMVASGKASGSIEAVMKDGVYYIVQYRKLDYCTAIVAQKRSDVLAPMEGTTAMHLYIALASVLVIMGLAWVLIDRVVGARLERITRVITDISKGELRAQIGEDLKSSKDEIGDLARAFDRTTASMKLAIMKTGTAPETAGFDAAVAGKRIAEESFKAASESAEEGIFHADASGKIIYFNSALDAMLGYGDASIGKNAREFMLPQSLPAGLRMIRGVLGGKKASGELSLRRKDGAPVKVRIDASPVMIDGKVKGAAGAVRLAEGMAPPAKKSKD